MEGAGFSRETLIIVLKTAVERLRAEGYNCTVGGRNGEPTITMEASVPMDKQVGAIAAGWVAAGRPNHRLGCAHHAYVQGGQLLCKQLTAAELLREPARRCAAP
jgi:hypothetical protein